MSEKRAGYIRLLQIGDIPLYLHWSLPLGGFVISAYVGFEIHEAAYFGISCVSLIVIHELGHIVAATSLGLKVYALYISGFGGECSLEPPQTVKGCFITYSAGLFAQGILLLATLAYLRILGRPATLFGECLVTTFTFINVIMLLMNLIPQRLAKDLDSDGLVLWKLLLHVVKNQPYPIFYVAEPDNSPIFPAETRLLSKKELIPRGFQTGIEILNDATTPMEFVVTTLMQHLKLDRETAITLMITVHNQGGVLVPFPDMQQAEIAAAGITMDALERGHRLTCRAVNAQS